MTTSASVQRKTPDPEALSGPAPGAASFTHWREVPTVLDRGASLLPAVEPRSAPFAGRAASWTIPERDLTEGQRTVVVSHYLVLMTSVCLEQIGAQGSTVVDGPFAANGAYCERLEAATRRPVVRAKTC